MPKKKEKRLLCTASHINGYFILKSRHMLSKPKSCSGGEEKRKKPSSSAINTFLTTAVSWAEPLRDPPAAAGLEREGGLGSAS